MAGVAVHGHAKPGKVTKEYWAWHSMIRRCGGDPRAYSGYSKRGISVCWEWRNSFEAFLSHIGKAPTKKHSVDRIDNNRGYEPGNVRWATPKEQSRNTRRNRRITHQGRTMCLRDWSIETGINYYTIRSRLELGWSVADALTTLPQDQSRS